MKRDAILSYLPHGEGMVLIDEVLSWDDESIVCETMSHQSDANPLLEDGRLPAVAAVEYGAQAMAIHECLQQRENQINGIYKSLTGVVGALKNVSLRVADLRSINLPLAISAKRMMASDKGAIYFFELSAEDKILAQGRITVNH